MPTRKATNEYQARVTDDSGVLRGKIPSPLVRELGARAGDYVVFRSDASGRVTVSISRSKGKAKGAAKKASKRR